VKPTPANLKQWANEAEDDLDARNAYRLRQAAGRIAQLEHSLDLERERAARLQAQVDRADLQAHSIKVLQVLKQEQVEASP